MPNSEKDFVDDAELEKDWKPSRRPQSTMARNFSAALDDLFRIDNSIDNLSKNIFEKKHAVSTQSTELEALEARLRAAEERLKKASEPGFGRRDSQRRTPVRGTFDETVQDKRSSDPAPTKTDSSDSSGQ